MFGACTDTHSANALLRAYGRQRSCGNHSADTVSKGVRHAREDVHRPTFLRVKECNKGAVTHTDHTNGVQDHPETHRVDTSSAPEDRSSTPNGTERAPKHPKTTPTKRSDPQKGPKRGPAALQIVDPGG